MEVFLSLCSCRLVLVLLLVGVFFFGFGKLGWVGSWYIGVQFFFFFLLHLRAVVTAPLF